MIYRKTIKNYEVGLVFKNRKLTKVLTEGSHWLKFNEEVQTYNQLVNFVPKQDLSLMLKNEKLKSLIDIIEVKENEIVIVYKDGLYMYTLTKGIYAYWKEPLIYKFEKYDTDKLETPDTISKNIIKHISVSSHVNIYEVASNEKALLFVNDEFNKELNSGIYYFWKNTNKIEIKKVDIRQQAIELQGQEILTNDKANLRINFDSIFKVIDINKALIKNKDFKKQLYTLLQMKLREYIGNLTLDEILTNKKKVADYILGSIKDEAKELGVEVLNTGIRDIILPGDIKEIMNQVLVAQKKAQANMISRREETAATRSLLNTAKLMEDNEMLFKLKEMEYVEKISEKIGQISVSGNGGIVSQLKEIFKTSN